MGRMEDGIVYNEANQRRRIMPNDKCGTRTMIDNIVDVCGMISMVLCFVFFVQAFWGGVERPIFLIISLVCFLILYSVSTFRSIRKDKRG